MTEKDRATAMELTEHDNEVIDQFMGDMNVTVEQVKIVVERTDFYEQYDDSGTTQAAKRIFDKIQIVRVKRLIDAITACVTPV